MSILEAMGYGLPIVTTNVGGIPQLVEEGKNGYMTEPGNIDCFVNVSYANYMRMFWETNLNE